MKHVIIRLLEMTRREPVTPCLYLLRLRSPRARRRIAEGAQHCKMGIMRPELIRLAVSVGMADDNEAIDDSIRIQFVASSG